MKVSSKNLDNDPLRMPPSAYADTFAEVEQALTSFDWRLAEQLLDILPAEGISHDDAVYSRYLAARIHWQRGDLPATEAALAGLPCGVAYSASKGGVLAMTRSIAVEYAKRGVRANCVCPGDINTGMTDNIDFPETMDWDLMPRIMSLTGARGPEVVAGVIAMLASEDGIHITGEDILVDGGTLA